MKKVCILLLVLCLPLLIVACSSSTTLTGKWTDESSKNKTIEFLDNGTMNIYVSNKISTTGTYKVEGDKITVNANGTESAAKFKIDGNKLTVTEIGSNVTKVYIKQ
jgi:uncharacterized protein (TIGR03066 family)